MGTLQEIEEAIDRLPREQVFALSDWLQQRVDKQWDRQFETDVASGRLNAVAQKAIEEHWAGISKRCPGDAE